jgi:hypothetical protein
MAKSETEAPVVETPVAREATPEEVAFMAKAKAQAAPDLKPRDTDPIDEGGPVPPPTPPQVPPPTDAQYAWFASHPGYQRISHSLGSYTNRGTLDPTGSFVPEGPGTPVLDGNGMFGVGIPV